MKKPVVDYREFRFSRLNEPRFSHLKLLGGWLIYFALYFLTENLIPLEKCHVVHCWLDDVVPFCEGFIIPYVFWYALIVFSLGYFVLYDVDNFKNLSKYIIITQLTAMAIYIIYPNRQDLRPAEFARDNFLTRIVGMIYALDTSSNVCPSLHVAYSLGIASTWLKVKYAAKGWTAWKVFVVIAVFFICISVAFVKQHSVVDIFAALPVCLLAEAIVFGKSYWSSRLKALHIDDNNGTADQHRLPYRGTVDWQDVMSALAEVGYDRLFNMEIPGESGGSLEEVTEKLKRIRKLCGELLAMA